MNKNSLLSIIFLISIPLIAADPEVQLTSSVPETQTISPMETVELLFERELVQKIAHTPAHKVIEELKHYAKEHPERAQIAKKIKFLLKRENPKHDLFWLESINPLAAEAAKQRLIVILDYLLQCNVSFDVLDIYHSSPLMFLVQDPHNFELVKNLIAHKASVTQQDRRGDTPLMRAAYTPDNTKIVLLLCQAGADTNAQNYFGDSALMNALFKPMESCNPSQNMLAQKVLLAYGANPLLKNSLGADAFTYAEMNHPESLILLNRVKIAWQQGPTAITLIMQDLKKELDDDITQTTMLNKSTESN